MKGIHTTTASNRSVLKLTLRLWGLAYASLIPVLTVAVVVLWVSRQHTPQPFRVFEAVLLLIDWSLWATLAPLVVAFVWWMPLDRGRWVHGVGTHLLIGGLLALGEMGLFVVIAKAVGGYPEVTHARAYWALLSLWYPYALLVYWVIAIAAHAVHKDKAARAREVEAAQLREQLTMAQLEALRMQLHPHFLCNTLNTVTVFLRDGRSKEAEEIVTGLGSLLHTALDRMEVQEITLRDELEFARQYLSIERIRFRDRMDVSVEPDQASLDGLVPCMILQPVVENAIRHGIARNPGRGQITIRTSQRNGRLAMTVMDDGPGLRHEASDGHGVGLRNAQQRLEALYGDEATLEIRNGDDGGVKVEISLPFHTAPLAPQPLERR